MIRIGRLYDMYGELLTERQRKCLDLHYLQDLSLGEIAAEFSVSRQAINDILHRTIETLEQYEQKLKLLEQDENRTKMLLDIRSILETALTEKNAPVDALQQALNAVNQILK
ncbi:MAG: YlxM family DNA-binding protein [Negativicutes bacterium]